MVYGFVKQSGGHVAIASEPGRGTTVKIYLPRYRGDAVIEGAKPVAVKPRAKAKEVVLVVEDEPVVRGLVIEMLVELGYSALEAEDGAGALAIPLGGAANDLLLTDVGLPGMNGRQLADAARERRPDLKVLFMTGYVENKILLNGFLGPDMEVISKPFAGDALATKIERILTADGRNACPPSAARLWRVQAITMVERRTPMYCSSAYISTTAACASTKTYPAAFGVTQPLMSRRTLSAAHRTFTKITPHTATRGRLGRRLR